MRVDVFLGTGAHSLVAALELRLDPGAFVLEAALQLLYILVQAGLVDQLQQLRALTFSRAGGLHLAGRTPRLATRRHKGFEARRVHPS